MVSAESHDIEVYSISNSADISNCYVLRNSKPYDCGVYCCTIVFRDFFLSRDSFSCYFGQDGFATNSGFKFNVRDIDESIDAVPNICFGPAHSKCYQRSNGKHSFGIIGLTLLELL